MVRECSRCGGIIYSENVALCGDCLLADHIKTGEPLIAREKYEILMGNSKLDKHNFILLGGGLYAYAEDVQK